MNSGTCSHTELRGGTGHGLRLTGQAPRLLRLNQARRGSRSPHAWAPHGMHRAACEACTHERHRNVFTLDPSKRSQNTPTLESCAETAGTRSRDMCVDGGAGFQRGALGTFRTEHARSSAGAPLDAGAGLQRGRHGTFRMEHSARSKRASMVAPDSSVAGMEHSAWNMPHGASAPRWWRRSPAWRACGRPAQCCP